MHKLRHIALKVLFLFLQVFVGIQSFAQTVPWTYDTTSVSHTILLYPSGSFSYNSMPFSDGDAVGVFYSVSNQQLCAGYGFWTSTGTSIKAYGAIGTVGGFATEEYINFRYWNRNNNCTTTLVSSLFVSTVANPLLTAENTFTPNGTSQLGGLTIVGASLSYNPTVQDPNYSVCVGNLSNNSISGYYPYSNYPLENAYFFSNPGLSIQSSSGFIDASQSQLGNYTVSVFTNSCVNSPFVTFSIHASHSFSLGKDTTVCSTLQLPLSTSITGTYAWSTGQTFSSIVVTSPGLYSLTLTDGNGCTSSDTIQVGFNTFIPFSLGRDTALCRSNAYLLSSNVTVSSYLWSTGQTTVDIFVTASGVYWGEVSNGGCRTRDSVSVQFSSPPLISLGNDITTCTGTPVSLFSSFSATGYRWSTGSNTSILSVRQPGMYILTVFGTAGCFNSDSIVVNYLPSPVFSLGRDTVICQGTSIRLFPTQTGTGYIWSNGLSTNAITVSSPGLYSLTITGGFGCKNSSSIQVITASIPSFSLGKDTTICFGKPLVLAPNLSANQYIWSTGSSAPSITVTSGGLYSLKVRSGEGCIFSDTIHLRDKNINLDSLSWKSQPAKCNQLGQLEINENTIKNFTAPIQYSLKNTFTNQSLTQLSSIFDSKDGLYELLVTDAKGCMATYSKPLLIQKTEDCKNPILAPNSNGTLGSVFVPLPGTVKIYDKNGVLKKQFLAPNEWDGTDESGQILPMGDYFLVSSESNQTLTITILK